MEENKASSTALTVLQGLIYTGKYSEYTFLVPEESLQLSIDILNSTQEGRKRLQALESPLFRNALIPFVDKFVMEGITTHYALRKRTIEDTVAEHIEKHNIQHIVNLGAGFDTLLLRYAQKYPSIRFTEVDHPATQKLKLESLQAQKHLLNMKNFEFLSVNFESEKVRDKLKIEPKTNTLFIVEGVFMYLTRENIKDVLQELLDMTDAHVSLVFTFAAIPKDASSFNLLNMYLKLKNEHIKSEFRDHEITDFFAHNGFTINTLVDENFFRKNLLGAHGDNPNLRFNSREIIAIATSAQR